jgi:hypothetical protein
MGQYGVVAPKQFVNSDMFSRFPMTPIEYGGETGGIGKTSPLSFYPYKEDIKIQVCMHFGLQFEGTLVLESE